MNKTAICISTFFTFLVVFFAPASFGSTVLPETEMLALRGGCATGMCGFIGACRDTSCSPDDAECSFKGGPGDEGKCKKDYSTEPKSCNRELESCSGCGPEYIKGVCIRGKCNNAEDSQELTPKYKLDEYTNECEKEEESS